jgi:predicted methyltransferase
MIDENVKRAIDEFFSYEEKEFYENENGVNINSMIYQFNEYNDDGLIIFTKEDRKILEEWVKENGWDLK